LFTGLILEMGEISSFKKRSGGAILSLKANEAASTAKKGDSISVNGVCLTVVSKNNNTLSFDLSEETLRCTNLGSLKTGNIANLEPSLRPDSKIGGHFVTGHVDGVAKIVKIVKIGNAYKLDIIPPWRLFPFLAQKGSAALDGISLTIAHFKKDLVSFAIIPHTFENTNLKFKKAGDLLNIEVDMIARYIGQLLKNPEMENSKEKEDRLREMLIKYEFLK